MMYFASLLAALATTATIEATLSAQGPKLESLSTVEAYIGKLTQARERIADLAAV